MRVLLVTPPMVQINAPYPATACLAGCLAGHGHEVAQADASLMLALRLFSRSGITGLRKAMSSRSRPESVRHFLRHSRIIASTIDPVIRFLQGHDPTLAHRIASRTFLPEGPRFATLQRTLEVGSLSLDTLSTHDFAMHVASLYLDDLTDAIHDGIDNRFELARYGEKLAASALSFDGLDAALHRKPTLVDSLIDDIASTLVRQHKPDLIGFTLPFPGNVYGALRMARAIKRSAPHIPIVMGGGYGNTELRHLTDPRFFDYTDYLTLDDGELPLLRLIDHLEGRSPVSVLVRTFIRRDNRVRLINRVSVAHPPSRQTPCINGPQLDDYVSMIETPNPMHRIWSCGRWNKLMMAHGCYWHRCAFCDTNLDYIRRYEPSSVDTLIHHIKTLVDQTGQTGFHFIDEAMPPALLRALATELIRRDIQITWWGNIRFDKTFTPELAGLLAQAGCIAVTGGLEAATDRLLTLMDKGFTLKQAARVTHALADAGILVHAYLMFGCPSQTEQDTVDSLEFVRQLFEAGCIQSAYWHRFALTVHSPIFTDPARYGIRLKRRPKPAFACNEVPFNDTVVCDHEAMGRGLRKALYNYMHQTGLEFELQDWFDVPVPPPTLPTDFVTTTLTPA